MLKCKICGKYFKHLGSHIWHKHKILAKEYKQEFGLNYNHPLITKEIQEKKKKKFWENPKGLENLKKGKKYQFKKGKKRFRGYISLEKRRQELINVTKINKSRKWERCPVCGMRFKNLASHLYSKHKLLRIKQ